MYRTAAVLEIVFARGAANMIADLTGRADTVAEGAYTI